MQYIVRNDPNVIAVYDLDLHYLAVSNRYLLDYNVKEEDIIGKHHYEVFPEMPQRWKDVHQRCLLGAVESEDDDCFERPDGSVTYNRWECRPWYRSSGEIGGIITYTEVTTERKRAEEELQKQVSLMESLLESIPAPVFFKDTSHVYLGCNEAFAEFVGLPKESIIGKSVFELAPVELAEIYRAQDEALFKNPISQIYESSVKSSDGTMHDAMFHKATFADSSGAVEGLIGVILDITERRRAEEALRESEDRYRQITENSLTGIFVYQDGKSVYANRRLAEMVGYTPQEVLSMPFLQTIHPDDRRMVEEMAKARLVGEPVPNHYELRLLHKDGSTVWSEVLSHRIDYQGLPAILGNVANVTQRRILEAAASPSPEDGGDRYPGRWHCSRLQQSSPHNHQRSCGATGHGACREKIEIWRA